MESLTDHEKDILKRTFEEFYEEDPEKNGLWVFLRQVACGAIVLMTLQFTTRTSKLQRLMAVISSSAGLAFDGCSGNKSTN
jgi:hypothetical protein